MLRITPDTVTALEADLLTRWKRMFVQQLGAAYPREATALGEAGLAACVRQMMEAARHLGGTSFPDLQAFVWLFFNLAEVRHDDAALNDFLALFAREEAFPDKVRFARLAFPEIALPPA